MKAKRKPRSNRVASNAMLGLIVILLLAGCDIRPEMRDRFNKDETQIWTDQKGRRYVVEHRFGANYSVKPVTDSP